MNPSLRNKIFLLHLLVLTVIVLILVIALVQRQRVLMGEGYQYSAFQFFNARLI